MAYRFCFVAFAGDWSNSNKSAVKPEAKVTKVTTTLILYPDPTCVFHLLGRGRSGFQTTTCPTTCPHSSKRIGGNYTSSGLYLLLVLRNIALLLDFF